MQLTTSLFLAANVIARAASPPPANSTKLVWSPCEDDASAAAGLDCATIDVPVDWSNPTGPKITLGMNRMKASDPKSRIGSLVFNPGGPGGSASHWVTDFANNKTFYGEKLKRSFDTIGLDPRGVRLSSPVKCDETLFNARPSQLVRNDADFDKLTKWSKDFAWSCESRSGPIVRHLDTISVARDLDAVRAALGESKLRFFSQSYGTQIAGLYAQLFPDKIQALVLDGVVDHSLSDVGALSSEAYGLDRVWDRFVAWCRSSTTCALYHSPNINDQLKTLLDRAATAPLPSPDCAASKACQPSVRLEDLTGGIQGTLDYQSLAQQYTEINDTWETLAQKLADAFKGNVTTFSPALVQDSSGKSARSSSSPWMQQLINCLDWTHQATRASDLIYQLEFARTVTPHLRGLAQSYAINALCAQWPFAVPDPPRRYNVTGTSVPLLLTASYFDPETPYDQAVSVQSQIPGSVLLSSRTPGHTVYVRPGPAADVIENYLLSGTLPADNMVVDH